MIHIHYLFVLLQNKMSTFFEQECFLNWESQFDFIFTINQKVNFAEKCQSFHALVNNTSFSEKNFKKD